MGESNIPAESDLDFYLVDRTKLAINTTDPVDRSIFINNTNSGKESVMLELRIGVCQGLKSPEIKYYNYTKEYEVA